MLIVYWPITIKFRTCEQTSKPQTNYRCCLWFSYLAPYWLISRNTITFHKYFWCSRFCEFHSKPQHPDKFSRLISMHFFEGLREWFKDQNISTYVVIFLILVTFFTDYVFLILLAETRGGYS